MKLNKLFDTDIDLDIEVLEDDSRVKMPNGLFFCIPGLTVDGHDFVEQVIENGAVAIVASKKIEASVPVIYVDDTNDAMNMALNKFYGNPLNDLKLIGITGTDGKTTTTTIVHQLLRDCAVIGSNGVEGNTLKLETNNTTPFPKDLFKIFDEIKKDNNKYVVMEVSSERILTNRMNGIKFDVTGLTNVTYDHINKHKTMDNYVDCKCRLFESAKEDGVCILNNDASYKDRFMTRASSKIITYGIDNNSDLLAYDINIYANKMDFKIKGFYGEHLIETSISGKYNVYNILLAIIVCNSLGMHIKDIIEKLKTIEPILGRANFIEEGQPYKIIIDYAHTPNALKSLLEYVNSFTKNKVITITGSAGGKDKSKRPEMGKNVLELSDHVIFTSDDLRDEDPNDIIKDLIGESLLTNYEIVIDRKSAIRKAILMAKEGDTVVIAGRGNDSVLPIKGENIKFNDIEETKKVLSE